MTAERVIPPAAASVSVVIPAKDAGAYLREALLSAMRQEGVEVECVVVDDGSRESPESIVEEVRAACGGRIQLLTNPVNRGRSYSRNVGVAASTGAVIAFLDADDRYQPGHLARVADTLQRQPGCFYAVPRFIDSKGEAIGEETLPPDSVEDLVIAGRIPYTSGLAVSRQCWAELGGFDCHLDEREDWDLLLRGLRNQVPIALRSGGVEVRRHSGNNSRSSERFLRDTFVVTPRAAGITRSWPPGEARRSRAKLYLRVAETCAGRPSGLRHRRKALAAAFLAAWSEPALAFRRNCARTTLKLLLPIATLRRLFKRDQ